MSLSIYTDQNLCEETLMPHYSWKTRREFGCGIQGLPEDASRGTSQGNTGKQKPHLVSSFAKDDKRVRPVVTLFPAAQRLLRHRTRNIQSESPSALCPEQDLRLPVQRLAANLRIQCRGHRSTAGSSFPEANDALGFLARRSRELDPVVPKQVRKSDGATNRPTRPIAQSPPAQALTP